MFETVAPEVASRRVAYETLPISIALHAAAVGGVVIAAIWNVAFPTQSPRAIQSYVVVNSLDPPLPAAVKLTAPARPTPRPLPNMPKAELVVAPSVIPDEIPTVPQMRTASIFTPAEAPESAVGETPGGNSDGVVGGALQGIAGGMPVSEDGRVHIGRDRPVPLLVLKKILPEYPETERLKGLEATVVVRYTIGADGWIKELSILQHAKEKAFDDAALKAIREWRFKPLLRDGKPIEVVHELTVFYELAYR